MMSLTPRPTGSAVPRARRRLRSWLWKARFVIAACLLGVAAAVTVHQLSPPPPPSAPMVVLHTGVAAGESLSAGDVRVVDVAPDVVPPDALTAAADAEGRTATVALAPGTVVTETVLVSSDLGSQVPPGSVIAAVRLAEPALGAVLEPGVRVDLLAPTVGAPDAAVGTSTAATYLARRALVLPAPAPDRGGAPTGGLSLGGATAGDAPADLLLVAVSPDEATFLANVTGWTPISAVVVQ